ncbi:MAG: D-alanine--D-alanine ligase [Treponema sp.]|nr:D-alanine--D-alanine ligase [Treponema sp.]
MLPDKQKITVGILFGGKSAEHEVSLQSAKNIYDAIDRSRFEPALIGIDKNGKWLLSDASRFLLNASDPRKISLNPSGSPTALIPASEGALNNAAPKLDVVFPILHGPFGEDGTVQGLLKLAGVPFVGSDVLGSAVGMDKDVMKRLFRDAGIPIGKFFAFMSHNTIPPFAEITAALGSPVFVKPANMGSSVGLSKAHNQDEFSAAVNKAFQHDTKIVIEEFIPGREIECAVLGNDNPIASVPGEVIPTHEFYSYEAKYLDENGAALEIPAKLDEKTQKRIQELSIKAFQVLCCAGLSRIDFFLKENGEVVINEINTIPGFTKNSMYPKLWEASGIGYTELISRLIDLALSQPPR